MEIEAQMLDKRLTKMDRRAEQEYLNLEGQIVDWKTAQVVEAQTAIEYVEGQLETQENGLLKLKADNVEM